MSLVTLADVRALINTSLGDTALQEVIDSAEAEITNRIGEPQNDALSVTIVKTLHGGGENLFFPTDLLAIVTVVEDDTTLSATDYRIWAAGVLERLPCGELWGQRCVVTYKPADDRLRRKSAIIDLVRIDLNRTAMKSEGIAGEYSYSAPDNWELERKKIFKRLVFTAV